MLCLCTFFVFVVQFSRFACRVNRSFSIISKPFHFVKYFFEISQKNFFSASWLEPAAFCAACLLYPTRSALSSTFSKFLKILFSAFQLDPPLLRWSYSLAKQFPIVNRFFAIFSIFSYFSLFTQQNRKNPPPPTVQKQQYYSPFSSFV